MYATKTSPVGTLTKIKSLPSKQFIISDRKTSVRE